MINFYKKRVGEGTVETDIDDETRWDEEDFVINILFVSVCFKIECNGVYGNDCY